MILVRDEVLGAQHLSRPCRDAAPLQRRRQESSELADDLAGRVSAGSSGQAVAGMRARAAEKKTVYGRLVARPIEYRTHGEKLIQSEFAVKDVTAGEAVGGLEILRRDDLNALDQARQIGRVSGESAQNRFGKTSAARIPAPVPEFKWRELHAGGENMLAFASERRIEDGGNGDVKVGRL